MNSEKGVLTKTVGPGPKAASSSKTGGLSSVGSKVTEPPKATAPQKPQSWDQLSVGDDTVPEGALRIVREETGQVLFQGTEAVPLIWYETAEQAISQEGHEVDVWLTSDVQQERRTIKEWSSSRVSKEYPRKSRVPTPERERLPCLPEWGASNGWDFWGRTWAYVDVPNGQPDVGVTTNRHEKAAHVTVAMLVNCPHERQYLPDLDVARSAAMAAVWMSKKGRVIDNSGNLLPPTRNVTLEQQARSLLPRLYGHDNNDAVWEQMRTWSAFRHLGSGVRDNPPMPAGDVIPADCPRGRLSMDSSIHRLYHQIGPTLPKDPTPVAPRLGLDREQFPGLPRTDHIGIGGIQGFDKNPRNLPEEVPAPSREQFESSRKDTIPSTRPKSPTTTKRSTSPWAKDTKGPVVRLKRMAAEFDKAVHQTLPKPPVLGVKPAQAESAAKASPRDEAMEVGIEDTGSPPPRPPTEENTRRENRNREREQGHGSRPISGNTRRGGIEGHEASASTSRASESRLGPESKHADALRIAASVLQRAGALPSPGQEIGVIPKDDWNQPRRADWSIDYFPPPDWTVPLLKDRHWAKPRLTQRNLIRLGQIFSPRSYTGIYRG